MSDKRAGESKEQKKKDKQERKEKFNVKKLEINSIKQRLKGICTVCSQKLKKCKKPSKLEDADDVIRAILEIAKATESKIKELILKSRGDNTLDQAKNDGPPACRYMGDGQGSKQSEIVEVQVHPRGGTTHRVTENKDEVNIQTNRVQDHRSKQNSGDKRQNFERGKSVPLPDYPTGDNEIESSKQYHKTVAPTRNVDIVNLEREVEKLKRENEELSEEREERMKEINKLKTELQQKHEFSFEDNKINPKSRSPDTKEMTIDIEKQSMGMEHGVAMLNKGNHGEEKTTGWKEDKKMWEDTLCQPGSEILKYQRQINELTVDLKKARSLAKNRELSLQDSEAKLQNELQSKSTLKSKMKKLEFEKNEALTRLSELAGRRLLDNNPSIADLSTEIRPTKIGENFKQLYDNEWTEAFEELTEEGKTEEECIKILLQIVKDTFNFAQDEAEKFESRMKTTVTTFLENSNKEQHIKSTKDEEELIKQLKRVSAVRTSAVVQDMYIRKIEKETTFHERCKSYVIKCMELCWYMAVQSPAMVIFCDGEKWHPFDEKYYARYTATGDLVDFVVWPCTLLHEKGPILSKGVAQATKGKPAPAPPDESKSSYESHVSRKQSHISTNSYQKKEVHRKTETRTQRNFSRTEGGQGDGTNKQLPTDRGTKSFYGAPVTHSETLKRDPPQSQSFKEKATSSEKHAHVSKVNVTKM